MNDNAGPMPAADLASNDRQDMSVSSPQLSVVVRSMDRPTLSAALDSIAMQDCPDVEVVVVNALGPAHRALADHCGPFPLRMTAGGSLPLHRPAAANAGLAAARGTMLIFLDDDDVFLPGHLSKLAQALHEQPDAVAAHTDVTLGRFGARGWEPTHTFEGAFDPVRLQFENFLPMHSVLIHRGHSAAVADCRFDESFELFEDWDFWLQLAHLGRFVHVPGVSARYVSAGDGESGVFTDSAAATSARARLFDKWRQRMSAAEHAALLARAQIDHRESHQAQAQLALAHDTIAGLRALLAARETEIAGLQRETSNLSAILAEREVEVADGAKQVDGLHEILSARDAELANARQHIRGLEEVLSAREAEIANARQHIRGLEDMLAARDAEIGSLHSVIAALNAEGPLKAAARALKNKTS